MSAASVQTAIPGLAPAPRRASRPSPLRRTEPASNGRSTAYDFGCRAERDVGFFLVSGGYTILGRRVRLRSGEIDIVAWRDETVAMVEVKARRHGWDGLAAVDDRKQRRLSRAADEWLSRNESYAGCTIRFDIALVSRGGAMEYLENAFDFLPADDFVW